MAKERNPLPFLIIIALILWLGLYVLKNPEIINCFYSAKPQKHRPAQTVSPPSSPKHRLGESLARIGKTTFPPISRPEKPQAAIILDDFGYDIKNMERVRELYLPVTISVLPNLESSRQVADLARAAGFEVMLHLPMSPLKNIRLEKKTVSPEMSAAEVRQQVEKDLALIGPVSGVNNHMGSLATADPKLMKEVLSGFKGKNLFFVDSITGPNSVAFQTARELGIDAAQRDVFLDNESKPEYIKGQIRELIQKALKNGRAIGIGHDRPETITVIKEMLPEFEKAGVSLVPVSRLVKYY
ncbi:MAG: divergent polysaccharide deacetylase family protein [Candidatus Omnitrophica bacterium]|nr:divergent polysaccharide deacetylase family protein [Candidatus Omnitrophota bacterium]